MEQQQGIGRWFDSKFFGESYGSWGEFAEAIKAPRISSNRDSTKKGDRGWYGTESFEEAEMVAVSGDPAIEEAISRYRSVFELARGGFKRDSMESRYDVCGDFVDIGRLMSGEPECMVSTVMEEKSAGRVIGLHVQANFLSGVKPWEALRRGAAVMCLVDELEAQNTRVELWVTNVSEWYRSTGALRIRLKSAGEDLDFTRIAYCLCHSSFFRRHGFRWREACKAEAGLPYNYGTTCFTYPEEWAKDFDVYISTRALHGNSTFTTDAGAIKWMQETAAKLLDTERRFTE